MRSLALLARLVLGVLASGCAEGPPAGHFERIPLALARDARPAGDPVRLARHEVGPTGVPDGWRIVAERIEVAEITEITEGIERSVHQLQLSGDGEKTVTIPGPFQPDINQVAVTLRMARGAPCRVALRRGGHNVMRSDELVVGVKGRAATLLFDLPRTLAETEPFDELAITFASAQWVGITAVDLWFRPWADWLPHPAAPEMIAMGGTWRRAVSLTDERPLEARLRVPRAGAYLAFAAAIPTALAAPEPEVRLSVELSTEGRAPRTVDVELAPHPPPGERWERVLVPLAELAGAEVRARFTLAYAGSKVALCALGEPVLARDAPGAPTVVLVTSDTHRADHLGVSSGGEVHTPFLDSLAARGVLFESCVSTANVTHPSHVAIMTGISPRDTGIITNLDRLSDEALTLAECFRAAGFATLAAVSLGSLDPEHSGLGQGFDVVAEPGLGQRRSAETVRHLAPLVAEASGLPLFVWVHTFDAHGPYTPPKQFADRYHDGTRDRSDPDVVRAMYKGEVTYLDEMLRQALGGPRFEDAIIAVTGDHGENLGNHGLLVGHKELYPDTLEVPLILAWPGAPAGTRVSEPVQNHDLGRTLLDLAGLSHTPFPGRNLVDPAQRSAAPRFALASRALSASVCAGDWFAVLQLQDHDLRGRRVAAHSFELYDRSVDPLCARNLADEDLVEARRLHALIVEWLLAARPEGLNVVGDSLDQASMDQMAELGYATDSHESSANVWYDPSCRCELCVRYR